jgi:hypothetical protein
MNSILRKVLGEEAKGIFPEDAEELDQNIDVVGKPLRPIHKVVQEPSKPPGEKERYLTPYSALTAPDCTPDSLQPIDPSKVPGAGGPERFTAADLENAQEVPQTSMGQQDPAMRAMDVLLGHRRMGSTAKNPQEYAAAGAISTEEAEALVRGQSPLNEEVAVQAKTFASTAMVSAQEGGEMPPPQAPSDGKKVYNTFRRFL